MARDASGSCGVSVKSRCKACHRRKGTEIWRLSTDGTLVRFQTVQAQDRRLGSVARVSPDRSRLAFVTEYKPPAAPLEVVTIENVLGPHQNHR